MEKKGREIEFDIERSGKKTFKILTFSDHQRKCVFPLCCLYTVNVFLTLQQTHRERKEFSEFRMGENEAGKMHNSLLAYVEGFRERPDFQKKEHRPKLKGNANENWIRNFFLSFGRTIFLPNAAQGFLLTQGLLVLRERDGCLFHCIWTPRPGMPRFNSRLLKRENVRSPSIAAFIAHPGDTAAKEATSNRWKRRRRRIHLSSSVCVGSGGMQGGLPPKNSTLLLSPSPPQKTPHAASGIYSREGRTEFAHRNFQKNHVTLF